MYAFVNGLALVGIRGAIVQVEVDLANGLPCFDLVGLPNSAVREAKERVRSALRNSGFEFPMQRITANLAPADLRKEGPAFDLSLAVGILGASGQISASKLVNTAVIGELSLDGTVRSVRGVISMVSAAVDAGLSEVLVPQSNAKEASLVSNIHVIPVSTLKETYMHLSGSEVIQPYQEDVIGDANHNDFYNEDLSDVRGHPFVKRALEVASAGSHNILLIGPPGCGKTMLARRFPSLLPRLDVQEALEVTKIHSAAGKLDHQNGLITKRPFRTPHHTISGAGLVGGGGVPRPGEVSLAHNGILFLDELPEFGKQSLEVMRQPLEDGTVSIARAQAAYTFPARFQLIAAMNPCPCGYLGNSEPACQCSPSQILRYRSKLSGPLLDRIDLHVEVPALSFAGLQEEEKSVETSATVRKRVERAREIQRFRFRKDYRTLSVNAYMTPKEIRVHCHLNQESALLLQRAFDQLGMSARAHDRILKVARTIADLGGFENIEKQHIAEAIQYRSLDRKWKAIGY